MPKPKVGEVYVDETGKKRTVLDVAGDWLMYRKGNAGRPQWVQISCGWKEWVKQGKAAKEAGNAD